MATMSLYDHTAKRFANSEVNIANLRVMLVGGGYNFDPADNTMDYIDNYEVNGFGWDVGGEPLANAAITQVGGNAKLDADDLAVTAVAGTIGPATGAVLLEKDSPGDLPLAFLDFQGTESAGNGTNFNITWDSTGIITWTRT